MTSYPEKQCHRQVRPRLLQQRCETFGTLLRYGKLDRTTTTGLPFTCLLDNTNVEWPRIVAQSPDGKSLAGTRLAFAVLHQRDLEHSCQSGTPIAHQRRDVVTYLSGREGS